MNTIDKKQSIFTETQREEQAVFIVQYGEYVDCVSRMVRCDAIVSVSQKLNYYHS